MTREGLSRAQSACDGGSWEWELSCGPGTRDVSLTPAGVAALGMVQSRLGPCGLFLSGQRWIQGKVVSAPCRSSPLHLWGVYPVQTCSHVHSRMW